jgi:hypothetical protein
MRLTTLERMEVRDAATMYGGLGTPRWVSRSSRPMAVMSCSIVETAVTRHRLIASPS